MKLRSNAKKKLLVDGGILYRQADKFYPFQCRSIDADETFGLIVQEQEGEGRGSEGEEGEPGPL